MHVFRHFNSFIDDGKIRDSFCEPYLIQGCSEDVFYTRFHEGEIPCVKLTDNPIQAAPHPQCPVNDLGKQPSVGDVHDVIPHQAGIEEGFSEGPLLLNAIQDINGHRAR